MALGEKIKNARLKANMSQEETSDRLNISRQALSNWENDKFLPDILNVIKMSRLFDISLDELLKDEKEIIEKLEKDEKKLKRYQTYYKYGFIFMLIALILRILNKYFELNNNIAVGIDILMGICIFTSTVIFAFAIAINDKEKGVK